MLLSQQKPKSRDNQILHTNDTILKKNLHWFISKKVNKVGDCSRGRPDGSHFNSYYNEV